MISDNITKKLAT